MTIEYTWRGAFTSAEANELHAAAFGTRVFSAEEWPWETLTARHSLGWATARSGGALVGFVNVITDGLVHAWLQDVMVAPSRQREGIGERLVEVAGDAAKAAGCEWLHVDFDPEHTSFYIDRCGFTPALAGLKRLG